MKANLHEVDMLLESNLIEDEPDNEALADAILAWDYLSIQPTMTHGNLLDMHRILMHSRTTISDNEKGQYRNCPIWIANREAINFMQIKPSLDTLFEAMNDPNSGPSDEWRNDFARRMHVEYERIHPFIDGNGRTGRMLMNWHRKQLGLKIKIIRAAKRWDYYEWFSELT